MNVSASIVRRIMRGSVWARNITSVLVAIWLVTVAAISVLIAMGAPAGKISVGPYIFSQAALQPWSARGYVIVMWLIGGALTIVWLLLIRAVFADLALGNIFCEANVRRLRNLGWLTIVGGIGGWLLPFVNATYFMFTGHHDIEFQNQPQPIVMGGLGQIVSGGVYLLASWIMAVGLGVREDAEELQRDAALVI